MGCHIAEVVQGQLKVATAADRLDPWEASLPSDHESAPKMPTNESTWDLLPYVPLSSRAVVFVHGAWQVSGLLVCLARHADWKNYVLVVGASFIPLPYLLDRIRRRPANAGRAAAFLIDEKTSALIRVPTDFIYAAMLVAITVLIFRA